MFHDDSCILLMHGKGIGSMVIRAVTKSPWSHCALYCGDGVIYESWQGAGVRYKKIEDWSNVTAFSVEGMSGGMWAYAMRLFRGEAGKPYDWSAVFRFATGMYKDEHATNGKWFCSELLHWAIRTAGVQLCSVADSRVCPGMIANSPYVYQISLPTPVP